MSVSGSTEAEERLLSLVAHLPYMFKILINNKKFEKIKHR